MSNTVGKNAVVLTASKIITTSISLASVMLLSRFRTLEEYGTYSQTLLVINLATALFMLGLPNSTNYFLALAGTLGISERVVFTGSVAHRKEPV